MNNVIPENEQFSSTENLIEKFFNEGVSVGFSKEEYSDRDLGVINYFLARLKAAISQLEFAVTEKHKELAKEAWAENYRGGKE
jgi:hypothetical protein